MHWVFWYYHLVGLSQNTFSSVRCCCSGRSTCGIWVWVTTWRERRRHTCVTWPWTALIRSCRCWSPCRGPCCWSSGTSTPSAASTSLWELQSTATSSWPSGTSSPLIQISVDLCLQYSRITSASFEYMFGSCPSSECVCVFQCGEGMGQSSGRRHQDAVQTVRLPLGLLLLGKRQVWIRFKVMTQIRFISFSKFHLIYFQIMLFFFLHIFLNFVLVVIKK